ncbi:MAG: metallophosphoesterase [Nanoarchaeota archaeon]
MDKQKLISQLFDQGLLLGQDLMESGLSVSFPFSEPAFSDQLKTDTTLLVLTQDYLHQQLELTKFPESQKSETPVEIPALLPTITGTAITSTTITGIVAPSFSPIIITFPTATVKQFEVKDFTSLFLSRYRFLSNLLRHRSELQNILPLARLLQKARAEKGEGGRESSAFIAMISEVTITKSGNILLTVEDPTGSAKVLIPKQNRELFAVAKEIVVDEVLGIVGTVTDKFIFADAIIWPEIPAREIKKVPVDDYAIFLSDIHVGSTLFLHEEFQRFLQWIKGLAGNEQQREIAARVKYIFIAGDLVDGVGVYPSQEKELAITDIFQQYAEFTRLLTQIPLDKQIIICPGNHDVVQLAEPQPALYLEYAPELAGLPNVHLVPNPSFVTIGATEQFSGLDVLLYHGYSFDYFVANVDAIRAQGGYHRADLIMKFLLKRRHLAPSFKSTAYYPGYAEDPLLITKVPDLLVTGHIHYSHVANYKGVTMISCSCWQGKTSYQVKLGHDPEPARVPLVNLRTREVKILRFGRE